MAIVTINLTDTVPTIRRWVMPTGPATLKSPVPRGILEYRNTGAVAAKSAGDLTNLTLTLTLPVGYAYLIKSINIRFVSDDLVNRFNDNALGLYNVTGQDTFFNLACPGEAIISAAVAARVWEPSNGTPKQMLQFPESVGFFFQDMDASASTAGDLLWTIEFYEYLVAQVDGWEVNTPLPTISASSF